MYKQQRLDKTCLLYVSYGTPISPTEIETYYTNIRRGQCPTEQELAILKQRYAMIGGSPLNAIIEAQSKALLNYVNTKSTYPIDKCFVAYRFTVPYIEDVLDTIIAEGFQQVIVIANTPFSSDSTLGAYKERILKHISILPIETSLAVIFAESWYLHPSLMAFWCKSIEEEVKKALSAGFEKGQIQYVFSAHSLPLSVINAGDTYVEQVNALLDGITKSLKLPQKQVHQVWQSQGAHGAWLGPDILSFIKTMPSTSTAVIICPFGFITNHLEILYDNDIECKKACETKGFYYFRTVMPNVDAYCIEAMGDAVLISIEQNMNKNGRDGANVN